MQRTVLTCAVLVLMAAVPAAADDDLLGCCMPDEWEGRQLTTSLTTAFGVTYVTQAVADVTYDAVNEREVFIVNQTDSNGNSASYKYLAFYGTKVGYHYDLQTRKCKVQRLKTFPERCIPAESRMLDSDVTLGVGANTLDASRVYYEAPSGRTTLYGVLLVTEECIPISETTMKSSFGSFNMVTNAYENIELGIDSDAIFDLPDACESKSKRATEEAAEDFVTLTRLPPA